ncbi:hypothetical protein L210DRAFT_2824937 [Boletus edulis BED1]|uniref:Uncharacterized protein n=1 Tax=Boletus edulis BED1 TaxID=1328754 RepID=A0AAD4C3L8_BOLED|nr:hypothetical protein L210DRAFT_2824937 [Boletus edulis BED1]
MGYRHQITLTIPAQVSCLSFIESCQLLVGSGKAACPRRHPLNVGHKDDGSVRLYGLDTYKVLKAIRGLGPISSVAFQSQSPATQLWVAAGRQVSIRSSLCAHSSQGSCVFLKVLRFSLGTDKLVLTSSDAVQILDIGVDDDDIVGEVRLST